MPLAELLDALDYDQYPQYYLKTDAKHPPDIAPLFRTARDIGVDGIYVFRSSPEEQNFLPVRPAVYVAEAQTPDRAREIHRYLWNPGQAPFLIVVLPDQIRVYTGFDYSVESEEDGLLEDQVSLSKNDIRVRLEDFCAESINTGSLWHRRASALKTNGRVDKRLLKNLRELGEYLRTKKGIKSETAHALIGKYVYIHYLRDRKILSDEWLNQHNVDINRVLGRNVTVESLRILVEILEDQLNGNIFPLDLRENTDLANEHVAAVASVFKGDQLVPDDLFQLSLDFKVYDFAYIPIETLSSIYEQFLHAEGKGKQIGDYYTPEYLADYLLSEMNAVKPLKKGMRILDPACGSGVFLVLTYRRLIEIELANSPGAKLQLPDLLELLGDDINILATELNRVRLALRDKTINSTAARRPNREDLLAYAQQIATELDDFITSNQAHHKVTIDQSQELIVCTVELVDTNHPLPIVVNQQTPENTGLFARLSSELNREFSQWVYIQRGLRIFDGTKVHIYKVPRLINWTRTQAFNDADDIIATVLSSARNY